MQAAFRLTNTFTTVNHRSKDLRPHSDDDREYGPQSPPPDGPESSMTLTIWILHQATNSLNRLRAAPTSAGSTRPTGSQPGAFSYTLAAMRARSRHSREAAQDTAADDSGTLAPPLPAAATSPQRHRRQASAQACSAPQVGHRICWPVPRSPSRFKIPTAYQHDLLTDLGFKHPPQIEDRDPRPCGGSIEARSRLAERLPASSVREQDSQLARRPANSRSAITDPCRGRPDRRPTRSPPCSAQIDRQPAVIDRPSVVVFRSSESISYQPDLLKW